MSKVKLQFEADLDYQHRAIEAVCGLFEGAGRGVSPFTVLLPTREGALEGFEKADGTGNKMTLSDDDILANLRRIQEKNGQPLSERRKYPAEVLVKNKKEIVERNAWDFSVEMETGTGKTYVYLRTIFELHKRYGFRKFMVVVPSIAIKEGVFKSIELMNDHFRHLYDGIPMHASLYDSDKIADVCNFACSNNLEIMVCTVHAIMDVNGRVMRSANEKTGGRKPIEFIRECRPIVIVDEPQNVGEKGEVGINSLNPLCTLRYSATHRNLCHPVFTLNAVDASIQKLVKQIEVSGLRRDQAVNNIPYIYVKKVGEKKGKTFAKLALLADMQGLRKEYTVHVGDELELVTGNALYQGIRVQQVENEGVYFVPESVGFVPLDNNNATADDEALIRQMIRETIKRHLSRAVLLRPKGIKVLSLFFLDTVSNYRKYENGVRTRGLYADIFEDEYTKCVSLPQYRSLWENSTPPAAEDVHDGYFSIDKGGKNRAPQWVDTIESNEDGRKAAQRAYELIMCDKERLLSLDEPLQFIFSHTALREGWDNPNVFQVCVLRDAKSPVSRRQIIGRGLRICVDSKGRRVRDEGVNVLTVVAKEHFADFADKLQKEYEADGMRFGILTRERLGAITLPAADGGEAILGQENAGMILEICIDRGILAADGSITVEAGEQLKNGTFELPAECLECVPEEQRVELEKMLLEELRHSIRRVPVVDPAEKKEIKVREKWKDNTLFLELWERIKHRTIYDVKFDTEELIRRVCSKVQSELMTIPPVRIAIDRAGVIYRHGGIAVEQRPGVQVVVDTSGNPVPDIVSELVEKTKLTRRTIVRMLTKLKPEVLRKVQDNCAEFLRRMIAGINYELRDMMVNGICYRPVIIGQREYDRQLFLSSQQVGDLKNILAASEKCLTESIVCDSGSLPERTFAHDAEMDESVKFYAKLPDHFRIPTPLGSYNPDWAVIKQEDGEEVLYFVAETKGSNLTSDLRSPERLKIACAHKHFEAVAAQLGPDKRPVKFCAPVNSLSDVH